MRRDGAMDFLTAVSIFKESSLSNELIKSAAEGFCVDYAGDLELDQDFCGSCYRNTGTELVEVGRVNDYKMQGHIRIS